MAIPIVPIIVTILIVAVLWWAITQLVTDAMILKVARVVLVVLACLWLIGLLTGQGPTLIFR